MALFFILIILVLLPDWYIWQTFVRGSSIYWSILHWTPTALLFLSMIVAFVFGRYQEVMMKTFAFLLLALAFPKLLFTLISLLGKGVSFLWAIAFPIGNTLGVVAALLLLGASLYGLTAGWKRLVMKQVDLNFSELPVSFDGYTIVQLSDFHIGTYLASPETVDEIVSKVNALEADAIVFTGDLVNTSPDEVVPFMKVLSNLKAKDGVFSILGNHDYCRYRRYDSPDGPQLSLEAVIAHEREMGWDLLLNEHRILTCGNDSIALIGVENAGSFKPSRGDLPKAMKDLPKGIFQILLSHDPTHWRNEVLPTTDIQLTLSGHTHAMQLKIGRFSPSQWMFPEWGGLYEEGNQRIHVSTGTGSNVSFRWGAWPEIDVITLHVN